MLQYTQSWSRMIGSSNSMAYSTCIREKILEGLGEMSFVGFFVCPDGIFAFGDSKATKKDFIGNYYEDKERGKIDKVFSNNNYVLGYTGNNDFIHRGKWTFLEDYFLTNIKRTPSWNDLLEGLLYIINMNTYPADYEISFLIGERNLQSVGLHDKYHVHTVTLKNHIMILQPKIVSNPSYSYFLTIGNKFYTEKFSRDFTIPSKIEDMEKKIPEIENFIKEVDATAKYNPVGLPLKTITFR